MVWIMAGLGSMLARTKYASAGRTADARKPMAPIKAKRAECRPRLCFGSYISIARVESR